MKKTLLSFIAMALSAIAMQAQGTITIPNVSFDPGETKTVSIELSNETAYCGFQMDVVIPEGFSIPMVMNEDEELVKDITLDAARKKSSHTISFNEIGGVTRIISYSNTNATYKGTSGALVNISVKASEAIAAGSYSFEVKNIEFTTPDEVVMKFNNVFSIFDVKGTVSPTGYTATVNFGTGGEAVLSASYVNSGDPLKLFIAPNDGYKVASLKLNGNNVNVKNNIYSIASVSSNVVFDVAFEVVKPDTVVVEVTDTIEVEKIVTDTIEVEKIVTDTIEVEKIVTDTIEVEKIVTDTIEVEKIVTDTIEVEKIVTDTIEVEKIVTDTIEIEKIVTDTIEIEKIVTDTIEVEKIVTDTIEVEKIVTDTIEIEKIVTDTIEIEKIVTDTIEVEKIVTDTIEVEKIVTDTIEIEKIVTDTIEIEKIVTDTIEVEKIVTDTIEVEKIVTDTIEIEKIVTDTIEIEKIVTDTIVVEQTDTLIVEKIVTDTLVVEKIVTDTIEIETIETDTIYIAEINEVPAPEITFADGMLNISCALQGAKIYYSTDGTLPTKEYTVPVAISEDCVVMAIAVVASDEASMEIVGTGIGGVTDEIVSCRYFTEAGVEIDEPQEGINIMIVTYASGKTETKKVVVRKK